MEYHYTYLLKCSDTDQLYMGVRTSKCLPEEDSYMSSSRTVKSMISQGYKFTKTILQTFQTRAEAVDAEIEYHNTYNVSVNPVYLNKAKQTSTKFDTTGIKPHNTGKSHLPGELNPFFGKKHSEETRRKMSIKKKGKPVHPNSKAAMAAANLGNSYARANKGTTYSPQYIMTCSVCHVSGGASNMKRYHFDNCKRSLL